MPFKPFVAATFAAMAVWGPVYASIGAASRGVLKSRGDVGAIFSGVPSQHHFPLLLVSTKSRCGAGIASLPPVCTAAIALSDEVIVNPATK